MISAAGLELIQERILSEDAIGYDQGLCRRERFAVNEPAAGRKSAMSLANVA